MSYSYKNLEFLIMFYNYMQKYCIKLQLDHYLWHKQYIKVQNDN